MESKTYKFRFISDPGHGWLEVPLAIVDYVGATDKISCYSYRSDVRGMAYLEEDCDYARFAGCAKRCGLEFKTVDVYERRTSIRGMPRFRN